MLIFNEIFNNQIIIMVLSLTLFLAIFYSIGRIVQNYFYFERANYFISIPIGFLFYFIINEFFYFVSIFIGIQGENLIFIEIIKNVTISLFILVFYKQWLKINTLSFHWIKTISVTIFSISLPLIVYFLIDQNIYLSENSLLESIKQIENGNFNTEWSNNNLTETLESYQAMYYWMYTTSILMSGNVEFVSDIIRYFFPALILIIISFSILGTFIDFERSIPSIIISIILSIIISVSLVMIGPNNLIFYVIPILIIFILFIYSYSIKKEPSNNIILMAFATLMALQSLTLYATTLLIILGFATIILLIIKEGKIVKNMIIYFSLIFFIVMSSIALIIFNNILEIANTFTYLFIIVIIFIVTIVPLYSLSSSKNRREELQSFEKKMHNRMQTIILLMSLFLTLLGLFLLLINSKLEMKIDSFFLSISNNYLISLSFYFFVLLIPSILIIIKKNKFKSPMLTIFSSINLIFNPITLPIMTSIMMIDVNIYLIFIPSISIIMVWLTGLTLNLIKLSIRL